MLQSITNERLKDTILNSTEFTDNNKRKSLKPELKMEPINRTKNEELRLWAVLGSGRIVIWRN